MNPAVLAWCNTQHGPFTVLSRHLSPTAGPWLVVRTNDGRVSGVFVCDLDWHSLTTDTQRADWCDSMQARGRAIPQHSPAARWLKGEPD